MKLIAVSQRVDSVTARSERRDALDQRWSRLFVGVGGIVPLLLPNNPPLAKQLLKLTTVDGFLLTGGNSLSFLGGGAPERDEIDRACIELALHKDLPLLGVCRGMQSIQAHYSAEFSAVKGHVCPRMTISEQGRRRNVNSYHNWGCIDVPEPLVVTARADDGVIKAVRHQSAKMKGIMWHPERELQLSLEDARLFGDLFGL